MPYTPEQFQAVMNALSAKVTQPCPGCGLGQRRQIVHELVLIGGHTRRPLDPNTPLPPAVPDITAVSPSPLLASFLVPCVVTQCTNCGFIELYNVHTLGIAAILGVTPPGRPLI